jgi:integrase
MPRAPTGTVRVIRGAWHAKWTYDDGTRSEWLPLPGAIPLDDEPRARSEAARLATRVRTAGEPGGGVETVAKYAARWCTWREGKGLGCVDGDRTLLARHILPAIGKRDVRTIARDDLKRLVTELDTKAAAGKSVDGKPFAWKTAVNAWAVARALFRDAQKAKDVTLCVRPDNPAQGIAGPDVGAKKTKTYLWPSEFLTLAGSERVPVRWGRLFALAVYTFARAGELAALRWEDVDLDHRTIHVHRSEDRVRKSGIKATKSETARRIPIEPSRSSPPFSWACAARPAARGPSFGCPRRACSRTS